MERATQEENTRVMVFGVFDGCDEGHRYFLRESAKFGDELIVVVSRDETVRELKGKNTMHKLIERMETIRKLGVATAVVPGDTEQHSWGPLEKYRPAIIALGHDQEALQRALESVRDVFTFSIEKVQKWEDSK